ARITARASPELVSRGFRVGQIASSSLVSLAHGTNDAQKTMGIITLALIVNHDLTPRSGTPRWVVALCATAIAVGTYTGGWRIIRTLGRRVTSLGPAQGFAAEATTSAVILGAASMGYAVSTTQASSGSIVGVGLGRRTPVRWRVVGRMLVAWLLTIPCGAACGGVAVAVADGVGGLPGVTVTTAGAAVIFGALYAISRRAPVTARNVNAPDAVPGASP
ncbi:MAG TPA: inorganic phosphate transporter, partial [Candidatus Dormibacteraeota bacterium]|nr:inorganic phosphate transporter [Candidatus Dormibacteraeota bacterium]